MNRFLTMLERVNLQNLSSFFQTGSVQIRLDSDSLEERESKVARGLEERMKKLVPESCCGNAVDAAMEYANDCCELYFTVGMKAGAKLMFELLNGSLKDN